MMNRTRFTFLSTAGVLLFHSILGISSEITPATPEEIESYVAATMQDIQTSYEEIINIPTNKKTFANTLRDWVQLKKAWANAMETLYPCKNTLPTVDLDYKTQRDIFQNADLQDAVMLYAFNPSDEETLDFHQRYILQYLQGQVPHCNPIYVHLTGSTENKSARDKPLSLLNLTPNDSAIVSMESLLDKILNADADIVCLEERIDIDRVDDFYQGLKAHYAHFYTRIDVGGFRSSDTAVGFLIASKYPIEQPRYTSFGDSDSEDGFIDFIVKDGETPLGHVYAAQLESLDAKGPTSFRVAQLHQILKAMDSEYREEVPFLLCGDLGIMKQSNQEEQAILNSYFSTGQGENADEPSVLLLCFPTSSSHFQINTAPLSLSDHHDASLSIIEFPKEQQASVFKTNKRVLFDEKMIIFCEAGEGNDKSWVDVSAGASSDDYGNESAWGNGSYTFPNGAEVSVRGKVSKDASGNTSRGVEGHLSFPIGGR